MPDVGRTIPSFLGGTSKVSELRVIWGPFEDEIEAVTTPLREISMFSNFCIQLQEFTGLLQPLQSPQVKNPRVAQFISVIAVDLSFHIYKMKKLV